MYMYMYLGRAYSTVLDVVSYKSLGRKQCITRYLLALQGPFLSLEPRTKVLYTKTVHAKHA